MASAHQWPQTSQKTIGLIGGMSWESSAAYYRLVNQRIRERLGGVHSARCLLWSFDFVDIERLQHAGDWPAATALMVEAAQRLQGAGADFLVICTNTMHRMAVEIQQAVRIPLLHIADPTGRRIKAAGLAQVGLLGTAFTMEQPFYRHRLEREHGLEVIIPDEVDRRIVHRVIYDELVQGRTVDRSRDLYRDIMQRLVERGAQAIILGCTEIMLLVNDDDASVPLFDTTTLHALAAADLAIEGWADHVVDV